MRPNSEIIGQLGKGKEKRHNLGTKLEAGDMLASPLIPISLSLFSPWEYEFLTVTLLIPLVAVLMGQDTFSYFVVCTYVVFIR